MVLGGQAPGIGGGLEHRRGNAEGIVMGMQDRDYYWEDRKKRGENTIRNSQRVSNQEVALVPEDGR